MSGRSGVPVRVRRVSSELRELRLRSGLGAEEVARALGISMSKLSRMESGQRGLQPDDVAALLGLYRVPAQRRNELLGIVRNAHKPNWWPAQESRTPLLEELTAFERTATAFRNYEPSIVPGLLQTSEYTVALCEASAREFSSAEVDRMVTSRLERQQILRTRPDQDFEFLIEQAVLERPTGGVGVMYRQLRHLSSAISRENVEIRVMPSSVGTHSGMDGPLLLLQFPDHQDLVYLENRAATSYLEEPQYVTEAKDVLAQLRCLALPTTESAALIASLAERLAREPKE